MIENLLISSDLSKLRRDLVKPEDKDSLSGRQKKFAELAVDDDSRRFIAYFRGRCKIQNPEKSILPPPPFL